MNSFNVEENSDLDTSNESYMSSSEELSDGEEQESYKNVQKNVLSREAKALVGRRFSKYFDRIGVLPENYWR